MRITRRRALAGLAAAGLGGAALGLTAALTPAPPQDPRWVRVLENMRAFENAANGRRFAGSWDGARGMTFSTLSRASESAVARVEEAIGRRMPETLRSFFLTCAAGVDVNWVLPGERRETAIGTMEVRYDLKPPRPFSDESGSPLFNGGDISIRLDRIEELWASREMWRKQFADAAALETDEVGRAHYEVYARFWKRGFPIATNGGGDVVAIDMEDPEERLFLAFHDGSDEPGWLLGQDLLDHLVEQSRLGFPNFEIYILPLFKNERRSRDADTAFAAIDPERERVRRLGLAAVSAVAIDSRSRNGEAWRRWVGLTED